MLTVSFSCLFLHGNRAMWQLFRWLSVKQSQRGGLENVQRSHVHSVMTLTSGQVISPAFTCSFCSISIGLKIKAYGGVDIFRSSLWDARHVPPYVSSVLWCLSQERPTEALEKLCIRWHTHTHTHHSQTLPESEAWISHDSLSVLFKGSKGKQWSHISARPLQREKQTLQITHGKARVHYNLLDIAGNVLCWKPANKYSQAK